jgi:ADP-ribosyl-[dinitrogen reductase] hydrolase
MPTHEERIEGGPVGLLVGDALGVPYEFHSLERLPPRDEIEFVPPEWFRRAHAGTPPGTRSDDGAQALALLASLLERDWLNPDVLGRPLLAWYERGDYAADHRVFDVGIQIGWALRALREGVPAPEAGPAAELSNGNGSLMRVLPLALWHRGDDAELVADARLQSRVTHGHIRSQTCCALSCFWARRMLEGADDPWGAAVAALRTLAAADLALIAELEGTVRPDEPPGGQGSGYVLDCLCSARWAVEAGPYEQAVKAAVALGNDTDTTACTAGGIAGLRDGIAAIPDRRRQALRGRDNLDPLLARRSAPSMIFRGWAGTFRGSQPSRSPHAKLLFSGIVSHHREYDGSALRGLIPGCGMR